MEAKKEKLDTPIQKTIMVSPIHRITDITMVAAISGLTGAKLFSVLEDWEHFIKDPIGNFFSGSGLTMYGGLILAFFVCYWYVRKKGIPPIQMMDAVAPALIVGYGVGRIGCQLSGDGDWGIVNTAAKPGWMSFLPDWAWAQYYPHNVVREGIPIPNCVGDFCTYLNPPVFPTPMYETLMCVVIFIILWMLRKRITIPGMIFCIYMILNGLERFLIEIIRINPTYPVMGFMLSQAQIIALGLILIGAVSAILLWVRRRSAS
jgi:prolipoprotein diacylglyceryl transferase